MTFSAFTHFISYVLYCGFQMGERINNFKHIHIAGGAAIAVPGNVKGLHHVWKKHGRLSWDKLIQPTINIAEKGFKISKAVGDKIEAESQKKLYLDPGFR